jgi:heme/copper-type cytochrome/quinol oxidase subunit 2
VVDVLHSWTIPSVGVKVDACSVKWNQANTVVQQLYIFFGQCSDILKVSNCFMPTCLLSMPSIQYHYLIMTNIKFPDTELVNFTTSTKEEPYMLASSSDGEERVPDDEQFSSEESS